MAAITTIASDHCCCWVLLKLQSHGPSIGPLLVSCCNWCFIVASTRTFSTFLIMQPLATHTHTNTLAFNKIGVHISMEGGCGNTANLTSVLHCYYFAFCSLCSCCCTFMALPTVSHNSFAAISSAYEIAAFRRFPLQFFKWKIWDFTTDAWMPELPLLSILHLLCLLPLTACFSVENFCCHRSVALLFYVACTWLHAVGSI